MLGVFLRWTPCGRDAPLAVCLTKQILAMEVDHRRHHLKVHA
jgi:hypothetical protein